MRLALRGLDPAWTVRQLADGGLAASGPSGVAVHVASARQLPVDWYRWRDACLGGTPREPIVESFTVPEGWSVTIVAIEHADEVRVHAFYAVFDQAIHAWAELPPAPSAGMIETVRRIFSEAAPAWSDDIVALVDL